MTKCAFLLVLLVSSLAQAKEVVGLKCFIDQRPSDGAAREFVLKKDSATYTVSYYDRKEGKLVTVEEKLITTGECKYNAEKLVAACKENPFRILQVGTVSQTNFDFDDATDTTYNRVQILFIKDVSGSMAELTEFEFFRDDCSVIEE